MSYRTDKLVIDGHTDTQTHRHTQATTIPEGQNWPRVKIAGCACAGNAGNVFPASES